MHSWMNSSCAAGPTVRTCGPPPETFPVRVPRRPTSELEALGARGPSWRQPIGRTGHRGSMLPSRLAVLPWLQIMSARNLVGGLAVAVLLSAPFIFPFVAGIATWKIILGAAGLFIFVRAGMER